MRRLLTAPLLVLVAGAISGPGSPHAFAQVAASVQLRLVSQSAWNGVGRPLHISFYATNATATALDDLSVELIVGAPTTSRSLYELSLTQDSVPLIASPFPQNGTLAPGETRAFRVEQPVDELRPRGDSGLFPLKVELRSRDIAVGTLRTPMIFLIERPKVPLNLAWTWVLSEPVQHRPDGTFLPGTLESDIAPSGRLAEMAAALDGLGSRQVDVVVSSVLVDQLERMAQGYRILDAAGTVRTVPSGQGGAADAAALLRTLRAVAGRQGAELMATPLQDPSLPALFRGGLGTELPTLIDRGRTLVGTALGRSPTSDVVRPFRSELDPATLPLLSGMGARTVLLDPGFVAAQKFESPPVFRLVAGRASVAAVLPNPELAALAALYQTDPVLAAQVSLGELAAIWLELPGTPARGAAVLFGEDAGMLPPFFASFARLVRASPWLAPITASGFVSTVPSSTREPVPPRAYPSFEPSYLDRLITSRASLTRFRETVAGSGTVEESLREDLLTAQSSTMLSDPSLGLSFIDAVAGEIRRTYDQIGIATTVVTLPSQHGLLPLNLTNDSRYQLRVVLRFVSDRRLEFVQGAAQPVTLAPGRRTFTIRVRAQTTGRIPVKVQVLSRGALPDTIAEKTMVIRSTAYNLVALFVTIGAALFLLGWWGRRFLPRRRS
jgi:hypothetical protein